MQSEKPSFARFGGSGNFNASVNAMPKTASIENARVSQGSVETQEKKGIKTAAIFDSVITACLIALFFGLPLFFTGFTFQGIAFEKQMYFYAWLLVGLVAWVSKGVTTGEMRIRRTPLDIPLALFWFFYVIAAFFSVDRWHSFWGFFGDPSRGVISITALVLAYYFILSHFSITRFRFIFRAFLVSNTILVIWSFLALMNIQFMPESIARYAPISLIGTVSTLAIYLGFLVPLFLTAIFSLWKDEAIKKGLRIFFTVFLFLGLGLTLFLLLALYAFVPWVVVLGGLSFFMVYILAQIVRPSEQWTWVPMLVFAVVLAFLMIGKINLIRANLPVEVAPNASLSWQIAKETLKENFIAGVGPANYGYAFSAYRPLEYNENSLYTLRFYQGMGLFFETLASLGALGTILLLVFVLSFLSVGLYLLTYEKQRNKIYSLGLWTVVVMFVIAGFISPINGSILLLGSLLSILALGVLMWESSSEEKYLSLSLKAAPKFALALAFIFMVVSAGVAFVFVFMGKVFVADVNAGLAERRAATGPNVESALLLTKSIERYSQEGRYYTRLGQEYMSLANIEASKPEQERDVNTLALYVRQAVAAGEQGRKLMPNDVMATESLALIYENGAVYANDALPKAEEFYKRAQELEPHNPLFMVKLGQIKRAQAEAKEEGADRSALYDEAKMYFEKAVAEKRDLGVAHYNLAILFAKLNETDKAIDSAIQSLNVDKNNLNYNYNLGVLYQLRDKDGDLAQAENIFKEILKSNEKLIDVRLSLGLLYEKKKDRNAAITEYEKILDNLPVSNEGNAQQTRAQIEKFIANVRSGVGNLKGAEQAPIADPITEESSAIPQAGPSAPNSSRLTEPAQ